MKKLVAACLPLVLIVVFMIVGVSVGESESLAGMVAGSHTATASTRQDTCSVLIEDNLPSPDGVGVISWTDENKKNAAMLARLMLGDKEEWDKHTNPDPHLHGVHLNLVQIAGILGNFYQESHWVPAIHEGMKVEETPNRVEGDKAHIFNGRGIGIAQWTYWNRKQGLINYADDVLRDEWFNPNAQVGFLLKEISEGYAGDLQSKTSVADATATFLKNFEKPGDTFESEYNKRLPYAKDTYAYLLKLNLRIPTDDDSSKMNECQHELGSVEGGSLADFKYNGKVTGNATPITNVKDFEKYGWNNNGTFDAKMLPGSDGRIVYFDNGYQCTSWVAVRMLSLGLTKRLMDAGITWYTLNHLGNGDQQAGKLHAAGVPMDRKPQVHDVVSYTNMNHVAFVEEVHGNTIIISEGNSYDAYDGSSSAIDLKSSSTENMVFAHVEEFLKSKGK